MDDAGELISYMHEAIDALQSLRFGAVVGEHFYNDPARFAADSVSAVASRIEELRELIVGD